MWAWERGSGAGAGDWDKEGLRWGTLPQHGAECLGEKRGEASRKGAILSTCVNRPWRRHKSQLPISNHPLALVPCILPNPATKAGRQSSCCCSAVVVLTQTPFYSLLVVPYTPSIHVPLSGNFEVSVVGDFDAAELEDLALRYVGTVAPRPAPSPLFTHPIVFRNPPLSERHQTWHLKVRRVMVVGIAHPSGLGGEKTSHLVLSSASSVAQLSMCVCVVWWWWGGERPGNWC